MCYNRECQEKVWSTLLKDTHGAKGRAQTCHVWFPRQILKLLRPHNCGEQRVIVYYVVKNGHIIVLDEKNES